MNKLLLSLLIPIFWGCANLKTSGSSGGFIDPRVGVAISYWKPEEWAIDMQSPSLIGEGNYIRVPNQFAKPTDYVDLRVTYWHRLNDFGGPNAEEQAQKNLKAFRHFEDDSFVMDKIREVRNRQFGSVSIYRYVGNEAGSIYIALLFYQTGSVQVRMDVPWQKIKGEIPVRDVFMNIVSSIRASYKKPHSKYVDYRLMAP